jgi:hypothetical protein
VRLLREIITGVALPVVIVAAARGAAPTAASPGPC